MRSAMTEDDMPLTRREALSLFPETILREVVEDDRFREVLDLKLDGMIVFDGDKARFGRAAFFDAIRELYRSGDASATVKDDDGDEWSIERGEDAGRKILKVRNAQASFQLHGFVALHHDAKFRLDEFDAALAYRSEEHTSELKSLMRISYAVFCLKQQIPQNNRRL